MDENRNEAQPFERQKISKGRRLFSEGESGDYAYIVETGEIGIYKMIDGSEVELTLMHPGEIFGEVSVLDGQERLASAIATMDSSVIVVSPAALEERIAKSDKFVKTLLQIFMSNLRDTHKTYKSPKHNFEGHLRSMTRAVNGMRDLANMTQMEDFVEAVQPHLVNIKRECDKLHDISQEYRQKLKG